MATKNEKLICQVIRERMKAQGLTMQTLAEEIGSSQSSVSRSLSGETELTLERLYEITRVLGVNAALIVEEAERRIAPFEVSEGFENYLCSDFRRYLVFVALNVPRTIRELETETNASLVSIQSLLKRLKSERLLLELQGERYQLNDNGRRMKFRRGRAFYDLKTKLYALQAEHTVKNLDQPKEFWVDRDDRLVVAYLTKEQAERVAGMLEAIANQISEIDRQNLRNLDMSFVPYLYFVSGKKVGDFPKGAI